MADTTEQITTVNLSAKNFADKLNNKDIKLIGQMPLEKLRVMKDYKFDYLDISETEFETDNKEEGLSRLCFMYMYVIGVCFKDFIYNKI